MNALSPQEPSQAPSEAPKTSEAASDVRCRLDLLVAERGLAASRARARDAILRGHVRVDGVVVEKPGSPTPNGAQIAVEDPAGGYVSRAALKLIAGLDHFALDPSGRHALDIGASTGGFTQVLLERGAAHVAAVDVGHGQLHPTLSGQARVTNLEGLNARALSASDVGSQPIGCVVSDVSFISLKLALPPALSMAAPGAFCLLLVKPQFEVGREGVGKGGIVRDVRLIKETCDDLTAWLGGLPGWSALGLIASPIEGGDGNREFLLAGTKA